EIVRILQLDARDQVQQGAGVPARIQHVLLERSAAGPGAFDEADPARARAVQYSGHGEDELGMRVVSHAQRLALKAQARAARQVELDGDRLVAHDSAQPAELVV